MVWNEWSEIVSQTICLIFPALFQIKYVTFLPNFGSEQVRLSTFTYFTFCCKLSVVSISFWCTIELNEIQSHRQIFRQFQFFKKTVSPLPHLFIIIKATSWLESYISLKSLIRTPLLKDSYFVYRTWSFLIHSFTDDHHKEGNVTIFFLIFVWNNWQI